MLRKNQTHRPFENREGAVTRGIKTTSKALPPAPEIQNRLNGWPTRETDAGASVSLALRTTQC